MLYGGRISLRWGSPRAGTVIVATLSARDRRELSRGGIDMALIVADHLFPGVAPLPGCCSSSIVFANR